MADEQKDAWDATQWHEVKKGETLQLVFGAVLHDAAEYDPAGEYKHFLTLVK